MYTVSKALAQEIYDKSKTLNGTHTEVFVVDGDELYFANWDRRGVHVKTTVDKDKLDWYNMNWLNKKHIGLHIKLSPYISILIGVWASDLTLKFLTDRYLSDFSSVKAELDLEALTYVSDKR